MYQKLFLIWIHLHLKQSGKKNPSIKRMSKKLKCNRLLLPFYTKYIECLITSCLIYGIHFYFVLTFNIIMLLFIAIKFENVILF